MCGGRPRVDTSFQDQMQADSEQARRDEQQRQRRIRSGSASIDKAFEGFDDGFFRGYEDTFMDLAQPQLDRQFGDARDELTYALARAGTLGSSMAGQKSADLTQAYGDQLADLTGQARDASGQLRSTVAGEKSDLLSLLNASGDADRASNEALSRSAVLFQKQPVPGVMPGIFGGFASGIGNQMAGQQSVALSDAYFGRTPSGGSLRSPVRSTIIN